MEKGINVLSLFDGMSCGQIALERAGIKVDNYFASEIKNHAIKVTQSNYPKTIQLGDVNNIHYTNYGLEIDAEMSMRVIGSGIDLIIGGSPCKGISRMNQKQEGLLHKESILFWQYVRLLNEVKQVNPNVKFLLENTHGNKEATNKITEILGVVPININSKLVSAQNRPRYYWTNINNVSIPVDKGITTKDIFDYSGDIIKENRKKWLESPSGIKSVKKSYTRINPFPKAGCLTANGHKKWNENYLYKDGVYRFLSKKELEILQTIPPGYTDILTYDEAYDVIGDGWTVDVIAHIFNNLK